MLQTSSRSSSIRTMTITSSVQANRSTVSILSFDSYKPISDRLPWQRDNLRRNAALPCKPKRGCAGCQEPAAARMERRLFRIIFQRLRTRIPVLPISMSRRVRLQDCFRGRCHPNHWQHHQEADEQRNNARTLSQSSASRINDVTGVAFTTDRKGESNSSAKRDRAVRIANSATPANTPIEHIQP